MIVLLGWLQLLLGLLSSQGTFNLLEAYLSHVRIGSVPRPGRGFLLSCRIVEYEVLLLSYSRDIAHSSIGDAYLGSSGTIWARVVVNARSIARALRKDRIAMHSANLMSTHAQSLLLRNLLSLVQLLLDLLMQSPDANTSINLGCSQIWRLLVTLALKNLIWTSGLRWRSHIRTYKLTICCLIKRLSLLANLLDLFVLVRASTSLLWHTQYVSVKLSLGIWACLGTSSCNLRWYWVRSRRSKRNVEIRIEVYSSLIHKVLDYSSLILRANYTWPVERVLSISRCTS